MVNGQCQVPTNCSANSIWNGVRCVCYTGYIFFNGLCRFSTNPIPICPANSTFNGVACACNAGYVEVAKGQCGKCQIGTIWNGTECSKLTNCGAGYIWNTQYQMCKPKGYNCGQNSEWNGVMCQCKAGYHALDNRCISCPAGTIFDGKSCSQVNNNNGGSPCSGSNQISILGQCICQNNFNNIQGSCIQCPTGSTWNGVYCHCLSAVNWCLGQPWTQNSQTGCPCMSGYVKINGMCVPV